MTGRGVRDPEGRLLDTSGPSPGWARVFLLLAELAEKARRANR